MRILIIDDSSAMRRILAGALKGLGYETVEQAGSGQEALERMSSTPFDVVFTDWIMPEMDGIELIRTVRATEAMVKKLAEGPTSAAAPTLPKPAEVHTRAAEERLRLVLGTRVRIVRQGTRGRIEIDFGSEDELIRIYEQLIER